MKVQPRSNKLSSG